ncbi:MAG: AMP-binding protein [Candidatus Methanomethylophilaceae archaeon]
MGAWESMKLFIIRRRLLANMIPRGCKNPLEEWMAIKARMTFKKNRELREEIGRKTLEDVSREDFEKYQMFRFREQMRYAEENSPYYRNKFKDAGVRPEDIRSYDDLERVPFTEASDLAADSSYFFAVSRTKMVKEFTTTGTTGHRKSIGYTVNDLVSKIDIVASALRDIGMTEKDSLHVMFPMVTAWDPSLMMVGACKVLGYGSSVCSDTSMDVQMKTMKDAGTTYIIGLPSFIYRVTALMGEDVDLKSMGIRKIISTSEPLSESMRHSIERAWGCKVIDVWGMTEFGLACAVECDEQNGLHTDEANMLFEIVDSETGKHVPAGQKGEMVISSLNAEGTVLLRYRTRDIAAMLDPPCKCGAHFNKRLVKPSGRLDLQFKVGMGYKVYPVLFDEVLFSNPAVIDYQMKITKEGYKDVLTFEIEATDESDTVRKIIIDAISAISEIKNGLEDDLIDVPKVVFTDIGSMEYAAKAKKIVDLRGNFDKE